MEGWVERAVASAPEGTPARVRALVASAVWHEDPSIARAALALADQLGDPELRSASLGALRDSHMAEGRLDAAYKVAEARAQLLPMVGDPDHVAEAQMGDVDLLVALGRLAEARDTVARLEGMVAGLTPHHRLHGVNSRLHLEAVVGDWEASRRRLPQVEDAVEANLATPCPGNVGSLLLAALAMAHAQEWLAVERLTTKAESIRMVGYVRSHAPKWLRLAIVRQDHGEIHRILETIEPRMLTVDRPEMVAAVLDALATLDDRDRIEEEAPTWVRPNAYVAPFAIRALGVARRDRALLGEAEDRFTAMGLDWHAQETRVWRRAIG
jgi:hypothetical protein